MPVSVIDTHAHLDMAQFDKDRTEVIVRAISDGVAAMVNPAVDVASSENIIKLAERDPHIFAAVGFHPSEAGKAADTDLKRLSELARSSQRIVAIGECGLDYYRNRAPREVQIKVLEYQLDLAAELKLPIIIHSREAEKDTLALLGNWAAGTAYPEGRARGVIHCFSGTAGVARKYIDMGFYIAFGGYITYPSSKIGDVIKSIPPDRLLTETDCPYLAPQRYRGQRNEPAYMLETVEQLSKVLGKDPEEVGEITSGNAMRLFKLPKIT